jgi:hypothetical protein
MLHYVVIILCLIMILGYWRYTYTIYYRLRMMDFYSKAGTKRIAYISAAIYQAQKDVDILINRAKQAKNAAAPLVADEPAEAVVLGKKYALAALEVDLKERAASMHNISLITQSKRAQLAKLPLSLQYGDARNDLKTEAEAAAKAYNDLNKVLAEVSRITGETYVFGAASQ